MSKPPVQPDLSSPEASRDAKDLEARLQASQSLYRMLFEVSPDAMRVVCDGIVVLANPAAEALYGGGQRIVGLPGLEHIHPDYHEQVRNCFRLVLVEGQLVRNGDLVIRRADGTDAHVEITLLPFDYEGRPAVLSVARDLTQRLEAESSLAKVTNLKNALSRTNEAILHRSDWHSLCEAVCAILVEHGEVPSAVIRMPDPSGDTLAPFARHGTSAGLIGSRPVPCTESNHPVIRAFRSGDASIVDDIFEEPGLGQSADAAREYGIRSSIVVPLQHQGKIFATLSVFSCTLGEFSGELGGLVGALAANLSFAYGRLKQQAELQTSEERFRTLTLMATDWYWETDTEHRMLQLSEGFAAGMGFSIDPISQIGRTRWNCGPLDMTPEAMTAHRGRVEQHLPIRNFEFRRFDAAGNVHVALLNGDPAFDTAGCFAGYRGTGRSITAQRKAEQALKDSAQHYRNLFDASPSAIRVVCDGIVVMANTKAVELFGGGIEEKTIGRAVLDTVHPSYRSKAGEYIRKVIESGKPLFADDPVILRADGEAAPVELVLLPYTYDGKPAVMSIVTDVTRRSNAEARAHRLLRLNRALGLTNAAIVKERDWHNLCSAVCHIAVEQGQLLSARIRMYDAVHETLVEYVNVGALEREIGTKVVSVNSPNSPPAVCFSTGTRVINNNLDAEAINPEILASVRPLGVGSAATFPMSWDGQVTGTFAVFASEPGYFDDELVGVLDEMAANLALAYAKMQADADLRDTNARLSGVIDSAMDAIVTVDPDMRIVVFNRAAEAIFQLPAAQAVGAPLERLLPTRFHTSHPGWMRKFGNSGVTARGVSGQNTVTGLRANGEEFQAEASISCTQVGGSTMYTVIMRDVTQRVAAQRSLEVAEARYRMLVEHSPSGVVIVDGEIIIYANPGLARMLGASGPAALLGKNIMSYLDPQEHKAARRNLFDLANGIVDTLPHRSLRLLGTNGTRIDAVAASAAIQLSGKRMVQSEIRDVTREVRAATEIRELNSSLERRVSQRTSELAEANRGLELANHDLESFSYSVAHDLRAPLRSMSGFAQLLKMDVSEGATEQLPLHVDRIVTNVTRMNALIDGLLHVAHASRDALKADEVDMTPLVHDVLRECDPNHLARISLHPLPSVLCDELAIRQVWINLISNALKYSAMRPEQKLSIDCEINSTEAIFSIADNGAGFDEQYAGKLFGTFQRLHNVADFDGVGIGLAIVKRIIERQGGRVWAHGKVDAGATFYFALPARLVKRPSA